MEPLSPPELRQVQSFIFRCQALVLDGAPALAAALPGVYRGWVRLLFVFGFLLFPRRRIRLMRFLP